MNLWADYINALVAFLKSPSFSISRPVEWTGYKQMKIFINRNKKTSDGIFGSLFMDGSLFKCFTCENLAKAILPGIYVVKFKFSPRFNRTMPHIIVPDRDAAAGGDAGILFHWGNNPKNYKGCVGVGNGQEGDSIDNTVDTFHKFYTVIKPCDDITLTISENYLSEAA